MIRKYHLKIITLQFPSIFLKIMKVNKEIYLNFRFNSNFLFFSMIIQSYFAFYVFIVLHSFLFVTFCHFAFILQSLQDLEVQFFQNPFLELDIRIICEVLQGRFRIHKDKYNIQFFLPFPLCILCHYKDLPRPD